MSTSEKLPLDPPPGCYTPEDWKLANNIQSAPEGDSGGSSRKPLLDRFAFEGFLTANEISVRLNDVTHEIEIEGLPGGCNRETAKQDLPVILFDDLRQIYRCDRQSVFDFLSLTANTSHYNPVLQLIDLNEWDCERNYLTELIQILGIAPKDGLSQQLLYKWACQAYWLLRNVQGCEVGADGILVLQGPQGCGKTTFANVIGIRPEFVKLGQWIDPKDRDALARCTSAWIVELGEIETTFRSDLERLKAFITAERDEYRLPYARAPVKFVRRTSFIGTCNSERFLIDPTGSRRFWTIPVTHIDLDRLRNFPALQFWRQIKYMCANEPNSFRLTPEERQALEQRNTDHEKPLKSQLEIEDIISEAEADPGSYEWRMTTVSDFKAEYPSLHRYDVAQIGRALDKLGYKLQRIQSCGKRARLRNLPCHKWGNSWVDQNRNENV